MANDILPFCPNDTGLNLLTQVEYAADGQRDIGNQPGVARSKLVNKAMRQATFIASQFAQFVANKTGTDVLDDGNASALLAKIVSAFDSLKLSSKTANYTLLSTDQIILGDTTSGAFTLTFPTAVGAQGRVYRIKKTNSTNNALSIATTSAQTINGMSSPIALYTLNEVLEVVSDNVNWQILEHKTNTATTAYTPTLSSGFGSGGGAPTDISFVWRRSGDRLIVNGTFKTGTINPAAASISLPAGLAIDPAKATIANSASSPGFGAGFFQQNQVGGSNTGTIATATGTDPAVVYVCNPVTGANGLTPTAAFNTYYYGGNESSVSFNVPIQGWLE